MIFTQQQIDEIRLRLATLGAKDTQFTPVSLPLNGGDIVAVVQQGENKQISINDFYEQLFKGSISYNAEENRIEFLNTLGDVLAYIDTAPFLDDLVKDVYIEPIDRNIVIKYNNENKEDTLISLDYIFNPQNYYTKSDVYNKTEINTTLATKANKNGDSSVDFKANKIIATSIKSPLALNSYGVLVPVAQQDNEYMLTTKDKHNFAHYITYDSSTHNISLLNGEREPISYFNASTFIKDSMVDNVYIDDGNLVITFITEGAEEPEKETITIPLTDIFDPSNYYTKTVVDSKLAGKLPLSGGSMTGSLNLGINGNTNNKLYTTYVGADDPNDDNREILKYEALANNFRTPVIGDKHSNLALETENNGKLVHKSTNKTTDTYNLYEILDENNVKTINGISLLKSGNNNNIDVKDVFVVEYYTTPFADIVAAYNAGKVLFANYAGYKFVNIGVLTDNDTVTMFVFSLISYDGNNATVVGFTVSLDGGTTVYSNINATDIQSIIDNNHKLSADLVDDTTTTNKFITTAERTLWNTVTDKAPLPFVVICGIDPSDVSFVNSTLDEIWAAYRNGKEIRVKFAKAGGVSFEDDATLLLDGSRNCVVHTVHNGTHHIVTIYDDNGTTKLSYEEAHDSDKQDVISDLSTIRSGAAAGATAYQKPQSGIPASDIASGVIPDISNLANKSGYLSQDFAAKSLSVLGRGTSNGIKLYRSDGQIPYGRIIMESDLVSSGIDYMLPTTGVAEQSTVVLATKASVDAKYTKPSSGIPASDIANGVIPDVSQFITKSVNDLVNYYTKSETYTQSEVDALISNMQKFHYEIYASLQDITTPANNVLYLIGPSGSGSDKYEEYVYSNSSFVKIGDTSIDLSSYVTTQALNTALTNYTTTTDLNTLLSGKQDTLVSGTNIKTINNTSVLGSGNLTLENSSNKTNDIANNDTDTTKYPSCKGVADYVSGIVGNINSILETI